MDVSGDREEYIKLFIYISYSKTQFYIRTVCVSISVELIEN